MWCCEQDKANKRRDDLEDSLQAQQYFADANEADSWMREKEPIVGNTDCGKDEDSAEVCSCVCPDIVIQSHCLLSFSYYDAVDVLNRTLNTLKDFNDV